ncbi:MAG: integrase DNA-binding domain-containing protein [Roseburia sp.]|nr:integrase DNA-binding domain-containing protein [Roseburia sp.]
MPNKRKDNKGRLLRTGENQRKDLTYMYRYTDMRGKRQCVYADDLNKLREKENTVRYFLYADGRARNESQNVAISDRTC